MPLEPGYRIGPYEIVASLGAGGMGAVYRARDSRLKRYVALKVLPDEFARDAERLARFQREAETLASLNHPGIAAIYDLATDGEVQVLVLEIVEGETLAERIVKGPLPITLLLDIARQLADALAAAHERGVVHRDLKPANIKLGPDGSVKVLDFGLAKMREPAHHTDHTALATAMHITSAGAIVGTPPYMSPEQASGQQTDRGTDVWAFGCVLYEMATGTQAFEGKTTTEVLAAVFSKEPDWSRLPANTPDALRRLLRRCLRRDRTLRLHDIADARIEIEDARLGNPEGLPPHSSAPASARVSSRERIGWLVACALATMVAIGALVMALRPGPPPPSEVQLDVTTPESIDLVSFALSPDGRRIVFVAESEGRPRLWVRELDSPDARVLPLTDFATFPFWSPDGRSIAFFADGRLERIELAGGAPQLVTRASNPRGGAWIAPDAIVFGENGPIYRVAASGGEPSPITPAGPPQRFPQPLPGARRFLYYSLGSAETRGVYVGSLDGSTPQRLLDADTGAVYSPTGHLLFVRQGTLMAQRFDANTLALSGNAFPVVEEVSRDPMSIQIAAVSVSAAGPIAYRTGSVGVARTFRWFDRSGNALGTVGDPGAAGQNPALSPDGLRIAADRTVGGNVDVWVTDIQRGVTDRLTSEVVIDAYPTWSPDGRSIAFGSNRQGVTDLFRRPALGKGNEQVLLTSPDIKAPTDWSRDGRYLLYRSVDTKRGYDLWALPIATDGTPGSPFAVAQSEFDERDGAFSPDGQWIADQSNESGRSEIYIQRFPKADGRIRVSQEGGAQVRWSRNGREVFFLALDGRLMAAPVRPSTDDHTLDVGRAVPLFATRLGGALQGAGRQRYMVSDDGQRFLMTVIPQESSRPISIILNWKAEEK